MNATEQPATGHCLRCAYWRALETPGAPDPNPGHCHRYPPVLLVTGHEGPSARREASAWTFPVVYGSSWCGEHRAVGRGN